MTPPTTCREFLDLTRHSRIVPDDRLLSYLRSRRAHWRTVTEPGKAATQLLADGLLSKLQAQQLLQGKYRGFWIGKYLVLEALGTGGMGTVLLCEQTPMNRLVAVKVLPKTTPGALERFVREARAVAALDHPNIVRAIDIDKEARFHFLVMEYVDGTNLQDLVEKHGPLEPDRACHYVAQAARGLQHAHEAGWVHRDIKPGNLLVDRSGVVKVFDMGLARMTADDKDQLTQRFDKNGILGTADYLAPEQSLPDQVVDARADIYSLGGTLYFLLTGQAPFGEGSVMQKILAHQVKQPESIRSLRPGLDKELTNLIEKMMDKSPARRPQTARAVAMALLPLAHAEAYPLAAGECVEHCPRVRQLLQATRPLTPEPLPSSPSLSSLPSPSPSPSPLPLPDTEQDTEPAPRRLARRGPVRPFPWLWVGGAAVIVLLVLGAVATGVWLLANRHESPVATGPTHSAGKERSPGTASNKQKSVPKAVPGILTPDEAMKHLEQICTVQMVVRSTGVSKNQKMVFLNSQANFRLDSNFTVVVQKIEREPGAELDEMLSQYLDKTIRVTGLVSSYKDQRQIVVADLQQVQIVVEAGKK